MLTHLPLDDELNQLFYFEEGIWRLVWATALGRCVLRRETARVEFVEAVLMIVRSERVFRSTTAQTSPSESDFEGPAFPGEAASDRRKIAKTRSSDTTNSLLSCSSSTGIASRGSNSTLSYCRIV